MVQGAEEGGSGGFGGGEGSAGGNGPGVSDFPKFSPICFREKFTISTSETP